VTGSLSPLAFHERGAAGSSGHGPAVIAELLGEVMRQLAPPLDVEGDVLFAVGPDRAVDEPTSC
jgi:hypothetical protein